MKKQEGELKEKCCCVGVQEKDLEGNEIREKRMTLDSAFSPFISIR